METNLMSRHASERAQQRGIPPLIVDWLLAYGAAEFDHRGAEIRYFDHRAKRRLANEFGRQVVDRLAGLLDAYIVVAASGCVVTVGHRLKRLSRH